MTVQTKSLTAGKKKRKESFEMDKKSAGSQYAMAACAFIQMYNSRRSFWGVAERSESFKSMIAFFCFS